MNIRILPATTARPMSFSPTTFLAVLIITAVLLTGYSCQAQVIISEIADKGTADHCRLNDWLEIHNSGAENVDISGWILHDDKGMDDDDAYTFPQVPPLAAGEFLLLCIGANSSPNFKIGSSDTLTLVDTTNGQQVIVSEVPLPGGAELDVSYALDETDGTYKYTSTPTPGVENIITRVPTRKERLAAQNAAGIDFFNMDNRGLPVPTGMDAMMDLHITMDEDDYQALMQNASYQMYSPFTSARVVTTAKSSAADAVASQQEDVLEEQIVLELTSPGRIRSKGQSTLTFGICLNSTAIPFVLEFNTQLPTQTLFGVERLYLRSHMGDSSYMREWTAHRQLARFGLPHLRTRTVRFFINNKKVGLYSAMEAVDQDYVFHRNFPTADFDNYALFKVKSLSLGCGTYSDAQLAATEARLNETSTPPYNFERGDHRDPIPVLGIEKVSDCDAYFRESIASEFGDVVLAYLRADKDCGAMLVDQGIIDRDLGKTEWDPIMAAFINEHLADNQCDAGCQNSNLSSEVDIDSWLKNFAVYAVAMIYDSPMGNGNNYYLADRGDGTGWNIVAYDQNTAGDVVCSPEDCNPRLVHWSIVRPTCKSLESNKLVGPLLTDATLHAKYIEYVRSFVDTVMGNASFIEQIQQHGAAIQKEAAEDPWGEGGLYFEDNLSLDPTLWNKTGGRFPLLPIYAARVIDVNKQLEALADGTYPRGPHLDTPVEDYEVCVDWRATEPDVLCPKNCMYDGCHRPEWNVASFCRTEDETCYHGDVDEKCKDIPDEGRYDGMQMREDGRDTFCFNVDGTPVKMSACPAYAQSSPSSSAGHDTYTSSRFQLVAWVTCLFSFLLF